MKSSRPLTQERLKELLRYDPETGDFTWLVRRAGIRSDKIAGCLHKKTGYMQVCVCGVLYQTHRLAWFYMTGVWPEFEIDHKNTIKSDNHWKNLRDKTHAFNMQNQRKAQSNSKTGVQGVSPNRKGFRARIGLGKKNHHLGTFPTQKEASAVYLAAKRKLHPGCTI